MMAFSSTAYALSAEDCPNERDAMASFYIELMSPIDYWPKPANSPSRAEVYRANAAVLEGIKSDSKNIFTRVGGDRIAQYSLRELRDEMTERSRLRKDPDWMNASSGWNRANEPYVACMHQIRLAELNGRQSRPSTPTRVLAGSADTSGSDADKSCIRVRRIDKKPSEPLYNSEAVFDVKNTCGFEVVTYLHAITTGSVPLNPVWTGPQYLNPEWPSQKLVPDTPFPILYRRPDWDAPVLSPNSTNTVKFHYPNNGSEQLAVEYKYYVCRLTVGTGSSRAKQRMFYATDGSAALCFPILAN